MLLYTSLEFLLRCRENFVYDVYQDLHSNHVKSPTCLLARYITHLRCKNQFQFRDTNISDR